MKKFLKENAHIFAAMALFACIVFIDNADCFAYTYSGDAVDVELGYEKFFRGIINKLTGTTPMLIGIFAGAACCLGMIMGNFGGMMVKLLGIGLFMSVMTSLPGLASLVTSTSDGFTILGAISHLVP